ncbi:hypothetical protein [Halomarina oriensis]|uniref:Uncharacterized protein n=1 Tax=Halomarina oriensis TaxID=671145 RepID=A0A6B0GGP8_9EURY|nr:hypothetical protein [Halomarina oriensis]MWG33720.1 hypothetical protein [Halomarina oriensis]
MTGIGVAFTGTLVAIELSNPDGRITLWEEAGRYDLPIAFSWVVGVGALIFAFLILTNIYYPNSDYEE